ncbi:hypothetical protein NIES4075_69850 [Tolypothrix sp. NIES-4075]|nr:hypothetical protein NIES4075_69850 [Tolypothrix sp. NIES-4075]
MWISGLDPQNNWQPMEWGRFKPTNPRINAEKGKIVKEEEKGQFLHSSRGGNPINKFRGLKQGRIISRAMHLEINIFAFVHK